MGFLGEWGILTLLPNLELLLCCLPYLSPRVSQLCQLLSDSLFLGSVMKLEEQKADLERQLKTLTKQIKVRCGDSRDRELLQHFTGITL